MSKIALLILVLLFIGTLSNAKDDFKKTGFFTNADCAKKGNFKDCSLDSYSCGYEGCFKDYEPTELVNNNFILYVHDEGKYYEVNASDIRRSSLDYIINKNNITLFGEYNSTTNTITLHNFK